MLENFYVLSRRHFVVRLLGATGEDENFWQVIL